MARLTIHLDEKTRTRVKRAAKGDNCSVSRWVKEKLTAALERQWPKNYSRVFGSLAGAGLKRPRQLSFKDHAPRGTRKA